jgi:PAS domain S-box-containing protein
VGGRGVSGPGLGVAVFAAAPSIAGAGAALIATPVFGVGLFVSDAVMLHLQFGLGRMRPTAALCLILLGVALALCRAGPFRRRIGLVAAASAGLVAVMTLLEHAGAPVEPALATLLHDDLVADRPGVRMLTATSLHVLVLSAGLLAVTTNRFRVAQVLGLTVTAGSMTGVLGFIYGERTLYAPDARTAMAIHTAVTLLALSLGLLAAVPHGLAARLLTQPDPGSTMLRHLLPAILVALSLLGWARFEGEARGLYGTAFGMALLTEAGLVVVCAAVWRAAVVADRSGALLRETWHRLGGINARLEQRLAEQARQLAATQAGVRGTLDAVTDAVVVADQEGRIVLLNRRARDFFGYGDAEVVGENVSLLVPAHVGPAAEQASQEPRVVLARHKSGERVAVQARFATTQTNGGAWVTTAIRTPDEDRDGLRVVPPPKRRAERP